MSKAYLSQNWYRVAGLKPRLRRHAKLYRTRYRGQLWYVLQDRTSGRFHRFSPSSHRLISMLDGTRTVQDIWDTFCEQYDDETLTQDEVIRLLGQLHAADVLLGDIPPDIGELAERGESQRNRKFLMSFMNPLAVRLPVFDPDDFVSATMPLARPLISWIGGLIWLAVVGYGGFLALSHWSELTQNVVDRVLTAENLGLLLLSYICVKAVHEMGHAYVVKRWGGEVHEIGVMFLVFMPVPYVDASDSMRFQSKWQRALVGGAGILVEAFLAAVAMMVWLNAEDGLVRAFAFNVMLIGGVSTLLFNGNPLLKFDGYYVLSDLIEIPNLAQRSKTHFTYLVKRYAFGMRELDSPATAPGEPAWFVFYAVASFIYRLFITFAIVLFVSNQFFFLGIVLAIWALVLMFGWPLMKQAWFLLTSPALRHHRGRAFAVTGGTIASIAALLFAVPLPHATIAEGVVWVPGDRILHSEADGIVTELSVVPGAQIESGTAVVLLDDPLISARVKLLDGFIEELRRRLAAQDFVDRSAARVLQEELRAAQADRALTLARLDDLVVRAADPGQLIVPQGEDIVGRFVRKGDVIGYVTDFRDPLIRVIVPERHSDLVRSETRTLELRFASDPNRVLPARIVREVPGMSAELPSMALSTEGGGRIALDPSVSGPGGERQALANLLHLDVRLAPDTPFRSLGERVYVRFDHGEEPAALQLYRSVRQIFLNQFDI
ncbi:PqqD family peptide modification chaperone [Maribius pontilimi]|uniref:PqqD family peptide modification chaperone n=1 Tax=Palleronia pontilimi TaxID=1964209 RepID=A0A934IEJ1_9RHOB|nr:PqqD family peptide modification chaperone [Palleronia pontilimi]MBJ3761995.1 PqqD family peptide modification chaperone [Palleronia pontilimi]